MPDRPARLLHLVPKLTGNDIDVIETIRAAPAPAHHVADPPLPSRRSAHSDVPLPDAGGSAYSGRRFQPVINCSVPEQSSQGCKSRYGAPAWSDGAMREFEERWS